MRSILTQTIVLAAFVLGVGGSNSLAQEVPWDVYQDPLTGILCDLVNAGNLEFVVLSDTGELIVVTESDYFLDEAAFVNENGVFFFQGIPIGVIDFAVDGDGFRTLWLFASDDTVLDLDPVTGEPVFTSLVPHGFVDVPCDAFELWDDDDFDNVTDEFDFCPDSPFGAAVDFDGCACFELDSDSDGVDDCDDLCPNTRFGVVVDADGCEIVVVVRPPVTVVQPPISFVCGNFSTLTLFMTFSALAALRLARRRYW